MKVKDLITLLQECDREWDVLFSSDEELNCLRKEGQLGMDEEDKVIYVYGLDGTEV